MDNVQQLNLFNFDKEKKVITKPIRLIELFSGIGAQAKALEILGVPFEHWKTCEWAVNSIKSYNAIHIKDFTDYSKDLTKEQLITYLDGNISTNYNEPCNVKRQNEKWLRDVYNNCIATHNLMNIMKVKGADLEIKDTDKYEYIMTYSFPCQDLSLAGKRQGMETSQADGGTRSGLLWEVERILDELEDRPQVLLMENVPEVIGAGNIEHFIKWTYKLEKLGYINYFQVLNGKNYGIPQNRRRCFMVSLLGEYAYDFPLKIKLKYRLKDFLDKQVEERFYLSSKMINYVLQRTPIGEKEFNSANNIRSANSDKCAGTLTTKGSGTGSSCRGEDTFIVDNMSQDEIDSKIYLKKQLCDDLIKNNQVKEGDIVKHSYTQQIMDGNKKAVEKNDVMITLTTRGDCFGVVVKDDVELVGGIGEKKSNGGTQYYEQDRVYNADKIATAIPAEKSFHPYYLSNLRIRKLTPNECIRLMGFDNNDYKAMKNAEMSDAAIYHCAGDSIIVTVLMAIFGQMLPIDENELKNKIENYVESIKLNLYSEEIERKEL